MNKTEILAEISGKVYKVVTAKPAENEATIAVKAKINDTISWQEVGYYEENGKVLIRKLAHIYVEAEGTDREKAWYHPDSYRTLFPPEVKPVDPLVEPPVAESKNWFQKMFTG